MAKTAPDSIYCKLLKLTRAKEDFFTESLAFALKKDDVFFHNFLKHITNGNISNLDQIQMDIQTQVPFPFGRLDMVATVNNTTKIVIENKLWSKEGEGQLHKYITNNEVDYLAFITAEKGYKIDRKILHNEKYFKPSHADHFTWEELFPVVNELCCNAQVGYYLSELRSLFMYLGFGNIVSPAKVQDIKPVNITNMQPTTEEMKIYDRKSADNLFTLQTSVQERFQQIVKENFALFDQFLARHRWGSFEKKTKEIGNKHGQIYAYNMDLTDDAKLLRLYITPTVDGNAVRVRFTINNKTGFTAFVDELENNLGKFEFLYELLPDLKNQEQLEIVAPLIDFPDETHQAVEHLLNIYEIVLSSAERAIHTVGTTTGKPLKAE